MAYSIESTTARRCTSNLNGQRCGLAEHHADEHVAPDGRQRWAQSIFAPLAEAWGGRIGSPTAGQKVTGDNVGKAAAVQLSQRMDRISAALDDRIDDANRRSEGARVRAVEASEAAERAGEALAREVNAREALSAELAMTDSALAILNDRLAKLELPYGHVQAVKDTHNALVERIERLEGDLRDTQDLAERGGATPGPDTFRRCDVSVPKQCVLQLGHGGHSHVSNSGTMWPTDDRRTLLPMPTSELGDAPKFDGLA